jgi:hypothetical protein
MLNTLLNKVSTQPISTTVNQTRNIVEAKIPTDFDYKAALSKLPYIDSNGVVQNMPSVIPTFKFGKYSYKLNLIRSMPPTPDKMYIPIESYQNPKTRENYTSLPTALDLLQNASYSNGPKDQGATSECVAYSSCLMREYQQFINTERKFSDCFDPSFVYNHRQDTTKDGMCIDDALYIWKKIGSCIQPKDSCGIQNITCTDSTKYTIPFFGCVYYQGLNVPQNNVVANLKNALYYNGPCMVAFIIYQACDYRQDPRTDGRIWIPLPKDIQQCQTGGHCMTIIGYDDSRGFLIQNSWGRWNGNGRVWLPYGDILQPYGPLEIWSVRTIDSVKPYAIAFNVNPQPSPPVSVIYYDIPNSSNPSSLLSSTIMYVLGSVILLCVGFAIYKVYNNSKKNKNNK